VQLQTLAVSASFIKNRDRCHPHLFRVSGPALRTLIASILASDAGASCGYVPAVIGGIAIVSAAALRSPDTTVSSEQGSAIRPRRRGEPIMPLVSSDIYSEKQR